MAEGLTDEKTFDAKSAAWLKRFNRWQATEYNTAVARCRTAKQFKQFEERHEVFPNIEWLPSRSVQLREEHVKLYHVVRPINDPLWQENQPGNLYNCKCDWQQTDKEPTCGTISSIKPNAGLDGNPAFTKEIITEKHPYYAKATKNGSIIDKLIQIDYFDVEKKFPISVIADKIEIADNVMTGRILRDNFKEMDLRIREHLFGIKNPEYTIDGMLSDAKRLEKYAGVKNGFKSAKEQGCKVVIIDFNKHWDTSKRIQVDIITGYIYNRKQDFLTKKIISCYVVFGNKAILINESVLAKHKIKKLLEGMMP